MAVQRHSNFDKTVGTISERNAIVKKPNGMIVTVLDAISDPEVGNGQASYRWDTLLDSWVIIYKSTFDSVSFSTEELLISNGSVMASNVPADNNIWEIAVVENDVIHVFLKLENIGISNGIISGLDDYNGKKLRFTYGYGSISAQLNSTLELKADASTTYSKTETDDKFTDAIYSKPTSEPIAYISGLQVELDKKLENHQDISSKVDVQAGKSLITDSVLVQLLSDISAIEILVTSDEETLNTLQEIVNFIELNKATLDTLGITNIAGLQNELDLKADKSELDILEDSINLPTVVRTDSYATSTTAGLVKLRIDGSKLYVTTNGDNA